MTRRTTLVNRPKENAFCTTHSHACYDGIVNASKCFLGGGGSIQGCWIRSCPRIYHQLGFITS